MVNSKQSLSILVDFLFLFGIAALICIAILFGKYILFSDFQDGGYLYILTEEIAPEYEYELSPGDELFDTVTKRKIGTVDDLKTLNKDGKICFLISSKATYTPKKGALRTKSLWFNYKLISENEFEQGMV